MPLQKGKKRKRARRHGQSSAVAEIEGDAPVPGERAQRTGTRRQRWKPPPWMNAVFGATMIAVGVIFYFAFPQKGGSDTKVLFLILYLALGGLYLGRAFLEYRRRQQSQ
jgi:hypothetical protein